MDHYPNMDHHRFSAPNSATYWKKISRVPLSQITMWCEIQGSEAKQKTLSEDKRNQSTEKIFYLRVQWPEKRVKFYYFIRSNT